jgi:NAD(P)-dependent dehydrogenase (short-subunit alcohol dehydrogenase family)
MTKTTASIAISSTRRLNLRRSDTRRAYPSRSDRIRVVLRLTTAEVELFAAASGDRNPLHVSPAYARATAFGGPIAHGVLGAIAAATALPDRPGAILRRIALEFPRPMLLDTDYEVVVREEGPDACSIEVRDGSRPVLRGVLEFGDAEAVQLTAPSRPRLRDAAAKRREFARGDAVAGMYGPDPEALLRRFPIASKGLDRAHVLALALCSYVIGMELPGELALFTKLVLEFDPGSHAGALAYEARVDGWQARTGSLRVGLELHVGASAWASGSLRAFVRADAADEDPPSRSTRLDPQVFAGKTALVIGASRGLGRSLARAFAAHGGTVFAISRSSAEADDTDQIHTLRADAGDPEQLTRALEHVPALDVLICNASPPLQPLVLEPATAARVHAHISQAVALVSTPLALCLPRLAQAKGVALLSSSQAVVTPPVEWAHYVAAKRAAEGLFEVAALQVPEVGFLVARMPRLDTAFTLNVAGEPAASAHEVALQLIERLAAPHPERGRVEIMSSFARA